MYYAHSTTEPVRSNWQPLDSHLIAVAGLAQQFGARIGIGRAAWLAGLLHDLGKYTPKFQARLSGAQERVDHSTAGAATIVQLAQAAKADDRIVAELIAYCIAGHHAGLPDKQGETFSTLSERLNAFSEAGLDPIWKSEIAPEIANLLPSFPNWEKTDKARAAFQLGFLGRMIFSCLIDADFKDTEQFYARTEGRQVDRNWPELQSILHGLIKSFDAHMDQKRNSDTSVNVLRTNILDHVRSRATEKPGLFTLTVPTGGGKTLASLGFALDQAKAHRLDRIIYAIPFTSIIDQAAAIFREIVGDGVVLEHHSAIEDEERRPREPPDADSTKADKDKLKLAMEDWAAPIVVTTNVQFFESLFAARTSRCRKLHNIANSVIVLDEAQTLPRQLLIPAVWALRELAENYGCSIVLCTATQPALDQRNFPGRHPAGLPLEGRELAPDPADLAEKLERVTLVHGGVMDDTAVLAELGKTNQGLVIVNSRKHALALYLQAKETGLQGLVHLTTRQYAAHRREVLAAVKQRLLNNEACRMIATSLVEAGVDLDFPRLWRAEAGLDQIAQAAGRCNREGRRPVEASIVTVFKAPENQPPPEIAGLSSDMARMMARHEKLLSPAAIEDFFGEVYWRVGPEGLDRGRNDRSAIVDKFRIGGSGTNFSYRSAAENFRMIESGMVPVIVARAEQAKAAIVKLRIETIPSGVIARDLQTYVVQVPPKARARLIACGHVKFAEERLRADQFAVLMTPGLYDPEVGLVWEDAEYLSQEAIGI
ncbi:MULTISPECIES: CRISPR-associated helicase/endonuclease Cas3 [Mesorhizobium]|uniref:CRISPR-associated helicase/endonuclease Cas3 n=1 Tax=Mesorhizobium TaxID=68287 RepID=UPI0007ECCF0D|nr:MULTISPECIES: CRISPR-associated helicase/endonuclease Cas3 [Mesorhizobium]PBB52316.1 CRISPR-associated helicase/endonuclease Cas3 [Mesorhizobium loti]QIA25386.1 CRISPR-associated helicase/endonuclease Cas3 [Mesorhizobium sp. AA22]